MKKTVCDLCGTDCQETGFLIPDYNTYGQMQYLRANIGHIVAQDETETEDHNPALDVRTPPITGGKI